MVHHSLRHGCPGIILWNQNSSKALDRDCELGIWISIEAPVKPSNLTDGQDVRWLARNQCVWGLTIQVEVLMEFSINYFRLKLSTRTPKNQWCIRILQVLHSGLPEDIHVYF